MNKGTIAAAALALIAGLATKYFGMELQVADGVTVQNQLLMWLNAALAGGGAWAGVKYLPNVTLPKLGGSSSTEFMDAVNAHQVLDEFVTKNRTVSNDENIDKALKVLWCEIRQACKECKRETSDAG